jgi:phosphatidylserine/phosphatidylglycerophosphate/cardiolipin synthase-like enzyme
MPWPEASFTLELSDANGLLQPGFQDIQGCLNGSVRIGLEPLRRWLKSIQALGGIGPYGLWLEDVQGIGPWQFQFACRLPPGWKLCFELQLALDHEGQLLLSLAGLPHWLSRWFLTGILHYLLRPRLKNIHPFVSLGLGMAARPKGLRVWPYLAHLRLPLPEGHHFELQGFQAFSGHWRLEPGAQLALHFEHVRFTASSAAGQAHHSNWQNRDRIHLKVDSQPQPDGSLCCGLQGQLELQLNQEETRRIVLEGRSLGDLLEQVQLEAELEAQLQIYPDRHLSLESKHTWHLRQISVLGQRYAIEPARLSLSLHPEQGLQVQLGQEPPLIPLVPALSANALKLLIDGPAYLADILAAIAAARRSIDLESFLYFPGETTAQLTRALALKAAGLCERPDGLTPDPLAPHGLPVRVLFSNLELQPEASQPIFELFTHVSQTLETQILARPGWNDRRRQRYLRRLRFQLCPQACVEGVVRADHRKLLVIDGRQAWLGGINLGDKFLAQDSFHDLMVRLQGPAVRTVHQAFNANWQRITGLHPGPSQRPLNTRRLTQAAHRLKHPLMNCAVLLSDAETTEIHDALLTLIAGTTDYLWLEHAYFFHPATLAALQQALERGVELRLIFPEQSNIEIYNLTNLENLRLLMRHQRHLGCGAVRAWLYTGRPGQFTLMAHTKAICADGRIALLGSANLTPRSLASPFREAGRHGRAIFCNQEINLYVEDRDFVTQLETELFEPDAYQWSRPVDLAAVEARLEALGGTAALQNAQWQARLT